MTVFQLILLILLIILGYRERKLLKSFFSPLYKVFKEASLKEKSLALIPIFMIIFLMLPEKEIDVSDNQVSICIERSEKQFKSCLANIPGTASESDMNYCLDLHEARTYGCRTGRIK
ncbi:hypothetical protein OAK06_04530 [Gammaproteobacteria bacterium]|nr:hypothetical protein [Gammaproteobacteria bacterium]|tara:strand:+ start:258 stop:608 length:351 start_codon:yes stop_codon:yes gene_type:complete